jgi:hypothetical protein
VAFSSQLVNAFSTNVEALMSNVDGAAFVLLFIMKIMKICGVILQLDAQNYSFFKVCCVQL